MGGYGYVAAAIAVLCFGSNFVPVKQFETGDGIFFQWVLCTAIWCVGVIVNVIRTSYADHLTSSIAFYPFAMLGGCLWCLGNAMAVPIIKCIGLGLGIAIWGSTGLIMGWASGTFGLFGLKEETVAHPTLNYIGAGLAVVGVVAFTFVKSEDSNKAQQRPDDERYLLADPYRGVNDTPKTSDSFIDGLPQSTKRIIGFVGSLISGFFYGVNFDPPQYIIDRTPGANGMDWVFSHFTGIFFTSTLLMIIYSLIRKNKPAVYPEAFLPAILSGALWAIAQVAWFFANSPGELSMVISFPIISTGPGLIASLWGVFVFREIKGARNFFFLSLGFVIITVAVVLIALSKQ